MSDNNAKLLAAVRKAARENGVKPGTMIKVTASNSDVDVEVENAPVRV